VNRNFFKLFFSGLILILNITCAPNKFAPHGSTNPQPLADFEASLTANGLHDLQLRNGESITYEWDAGLVGTCAANGMTCSSNFTSTCGQSGSWIANTESGSSTRTVNTTPNCTFTINYFVKEDGVTIAYDTVNLLVLPAASSSSSSSSRPSSSSSSAAASSSSAAASSSSAAASSSSSASHASSSSERPDPPERCYEHGHQVPCP
jgi:hypothetical protein